MSEERSCCSFFPFLRAPSSNVAIIEGSHKYSYHSLSRRIDLVAISLLNGKSDLNEERIATYIPASMDYVCTLHGVWRAGGIALPLNTASAVLELEYYLTSAGATRIITIEKYVELLRTLCDSLNIEVIVASSLGLSAEVDIEGQRGEIFPDIAYDRRLMILFTSGTTNKPKGVVTTRRNIEAQIKSLVEAWEWTSDDVIPLFLPMHHIHGIINILSCALWAGASVHMYPSFDMPAILDQVASNTFTVFMAVPTVYVKIIQYLESTSSPSDQNSDEDRSARRAAICEGFQSMRLNVSGSASCPMSLFQKWNLLTQQVQT